MKETTSSPPFLVRRLILVYGLVFFWSVTLVGRFVYLQVFCVEELRTKASLQYSGFDDVTENRGEIFDRRLIQLATNVDAHKLGAELKLIEEPLALAQRLAPLLGQPVRELEEKLSRSDTPYVVLEQRCEPEQARRIRELDVKGLVLDRVSVRYYPKSPLAAQLLGFVGTDGQGLSGLEYFYDAEIRGDRKRVYFVFDGQRRSYQRAQPDSSSEGNVLVLSIDQAIQFEAEQALKRQVEACRAKSGTVIVMNPKNGEILAMATHPTFDPNDFKSAEPEQYRNRATLDTYEPGSIFKIVSLSAVLNESLATLDEVVDCRVGTLRIARKVYREAKRSYGDLTVTQILAKSSNVGTIKLNQRLGEEKLHEYLTRFGFGGKTGIDYPGEEPGNVRPVSEWSKMSIAALSIGQELAVTPLQMVRAVAAIANGGFLVRPHLVRQILNREGDPVWTAEVDRERILATLTTDRMRRAMEAVVESGTGTRAKLTGFSSGGKTGTAQKFVNGSYSHHQYVASYTGFAPLDEPALAALVVIDEPRGDYYGGLVAAPVFKEVMDKALIHLKIPRDQPLDRETPRRELASRELPANSGVFNSEDEEDLPPGFLDEAVDSRTDFRPAAALTERVFILPDHLVEVPDFGGLSLRNVASECARLGLHLKAVGLGVAAGQRPRAGQSVQKGSMCEVFFSSKGIPRRAANRIALQNPLPELSEGVQ